MTHKIMDIPLKQKYVYIRDYPYFLEISQHASLIRYNWALFALSAGSTVHTLLHVLCSYCTA